MNCLPLIERELRLGLRRWPSGPQVRFLCALAALVGAFAILFVWSAWNPTAGFGRPFLHALSAAGYGGALITGIVLVADSLSQEKREGTLDLLLLTDVRLSDVLLGKLLARAIVPFYGFLAVLPALEISVMVGGTTVGECVRLFLVWVNALLISLAVCLFTSALSREQRAAYAGAILLLIALAVGLPLLAVSRPLSLAPGALSFLALLCSPSSPYWFAANYPSQAVWFWTALVVNQLAAWSLLFAAHRALLWNRTRSLPTGRWTPGEAASSRLARSVKASRAALLDSSPVEWLAARRSGNSLNLWFIATLAVAGAFSFQPGAFGLSKYRAAFVLLLAPHLLLKVAAALDATYAFAADRRSGALESLLATCVAVPEITAGMFRNLRRRFLGPVLVTSLVGVTCAVRSFSVGEPEAAAVILAAALIFPVDIYCLYWVGLFQGLAARSAVVGLGTAVLEILLLPWAWFIMGGQVFWRSSTSELVLLWILLTAVNHAWWRTSARTQLFRHFRTLALKPYGGKNPVMESDWSPINWEEEVAEPGTQSP